MVRAAEEAAIQEYVGGWASKNWVDFGRPHRDSSDSKSQKKTWVYFGLLVLHPPLQAVWLGGWVAGVSLTGKKTSVRVPIFPKKAEGTPCAQPWLVAVGNWRLAAVGGWQLTTRGWWRFVVVGGGGGWRLVVGGGWQWLAVGGWSPLAVGGGWPLMVGGGWWLAVGGG